MAGDLSSGVTFTALDITARKRAEEALKRSEEQFRAIFDSARDGILLADAETMRFHTGNEAICRMLGYSLAEIRTIGFEDIHPEEDLPYVIEQFEKLKRRDIAFTKDIPVKRKDGTIFFVDINVSTVTLDGNIYVMGMFRDLSERLQAEEALRESEAKYRTLFESSAEGFFLCTDIIFDCNEQACKLWKCDREDIVGHSPVEFSPEFQPDGRRSATAAHEYITAALGGTPQFFYWQHRRKDGVLIDTEISLKSVVVNRQQLLQATMRDITERRQAEKALRESEERYRLLFEQSPLGIFHFDQNGVIQDCNDNFVRITGSSKERLIGFNMLTSLKEETLRHAIIKALSGNLGYYEGDCHSVTAGKVTPVRMLLGRITNHEFMGGIGIVEDISARKRAEEASQNLVASSPIGIYIVQEGKFRLVNPGFQGITGFSEEELLGQNSLNLVVPEYRVTVREKAVQMLKGESTFPYEFQIVTKDGDLKWVMETVIPSQYGGERATLGYFMDITEHQRLEAQLAQAQRMEAVGMLAGGLAHDFNNLLTAVTGYGDIMMLALHPDDPLRYYVEEILKAADRGDSLTRQLLAFSRRQILQPQVLNLNEVVAQIDTMLRRLKIGRAHV